MVQWIIRAQQQAWLHMNTTQTAQRRFPFPVLLLAPTETETAVPPAISIFIWLLIPGVYQSSFQVRIKTSNPLQHKHWCYPNPAGLKRTCLKQEVEGSTLHTVGRQWVFCDTALPKWRRWHKTWNISKIIWYFHKIQHPEIPLWWWGFQRCLERWK